MFFPSGDVKFHFIRFHNNAGSLGASRLWLLTPLAREKGAGHDHCRRGLSPERASWREALLVPAAWVLFFGGNLGIEILRFGAFMRRVLETAPRMI
jgi:hypothetical protein